MIKAPSRTYNFSDAELCMLVSDMVIRMTRDSAQFLTRGVTAANITTFETLGNAFEVFPPDDVYLGEIKELTDEKDELRANCTVLIQNISGYYDQKWGIGSGKYTTLSIDNLQTKGDDSFLVACRNVVSRATADLSALTSIGLTQLMIDDLEDEAQLFEDKRNALTTAREFREQQTYLRIQKGNELYELLTKYSKIGKLIWENTDPIKYDEYILYRKTTTLPSKVQNLQYDAFNTKLKWDNAANTDNYELEMKQVGPSFTYLVIYFGPSNEFIYTPASGAWLFRCRGKNSDGSGTWSEELSVVQP